MKVTIKSLSEATGFSPATISNALNNRSGVNKKTAETILTVAKNYGYISETRIKSVKFVIFKNSGSIVSDTPFFSSLIEGVEMECRIAGLDMTIVNLHKNGPDFEALQEQLISDLNSAILLLATEMSEEDMLPFRHVASPIVVLDSWFEHVLYDSVLMSNTDSVYIAVKHLIEMGHKKIGYIKGNIRIKNFYFREIGYARALDMAGIERNALFEVPVTPTMDGARADMLAHLKTNPQLPTAFFADNDIMALGAMKALQEFGLKIPQDVSMIGLDDLPFCAISSPSLTTIRVHKHGMGQAAIRRLTELIKNRDEAKQKILVCNEFIVRDSVRDLNSPK